MDKDITIKSRTLVIAIVVVILLIVCTLFVGLSINKHNILQIDPNINNPVVNNKNEEFSKTIKIPGFSIVNIEKDSDEVNIVLQNPDGNPCYFIYKLILDDNDEVLYESKLIPPGKAINGISLNKTFKEGEYKATFNVSTISIKDGSPMNGANIKMTLIVK